MRGKEVLSPFNNKIGGSLLNIRQIIPRFQQPKPNGYNSYMVKCPCHNDHTQSLCITEKNGKILMNCFAGCRIEDIARATGLEMKDLFVESLPNPSKPPTVEYVYTDRLIKTRFYRLVNGEWQKSFYWKHRDKNGVWQKGKGDYTVPLYRQYRLKLAKESDTIYIVEGEKDTDTLTDKLGLIAVSPPNGATKGDSKSKWDSSYNMQFKGLNVAIVPDNDDVGRAYAETIARQLFPIARTVKIIDLRREWENLKEKGDITDVYESEAPTRERSIAEAVKYKLTMLTELTKPYTIEEAPAIPVWAYEDRGQWRIDEKQYITDFAKRHNVKCINNQLYSVDGAIQDGKAKQMILKEILDYVQTNHGDKAEKLLKGIKQYSYIEQPKPDMDKIHFKNGTLCRDKNGLFTMWSDKKEFCINRINASVNPKAPEPKRFMEYLHTVFNEDDIQTLQQYCGYCLLPTTVMQKALLVIGDGGEGKSVLGTILNEIIGENNCYNASVKDLEGSFGVANVENKLVYIDDDVSEKALTNSGVFKSLVTNKNNISEKALTNSGVFKSLVTNKNNIEAKKKFQQTNVIKSYVRFICFGNFALQALYDTSDGFYRRLLALRVKPKDKNRVDNPFIDREIIDNEAEGVVLWLIYGLNKVIKRNFSIYTSERTEAESEKIKHENDSVLAFLQSEYVTFGEDLKVHTSDLYKEYCGFCEENAYNHLVTANSFSKALHNRRNEFGIIPSSGIKMRGKRARGFRGIGCEIIATSGVHT